MMLREKVADLCDLLGTTQDEALILFHHYRWNRDHLENSGYFDNSRKIRTQAGLPTTETTTTVAPPKEIKCKVCWNTKTSSEIDAPACGHYLCKQCWRDYLESKVEDKADGAFYRCPGEKCTLILLDQYVSKSKINLYEKKLAMNYAEENKAIRWCPAPDCNYCVENPNLNTRPIQCRCGFVYCFKCGKEDHQPCDCKLTDNWNMKNSSESENTRWLLVFTKMCPKCRRPIEKNQGCNHMTCRHGSCGYEFCWLCLGDWKSHQGTHYKCNVYESLTEEEKKNQKVNIDREKSELEKYIFYFERYNNHDKGLGVARELVKKMEQNMLELHDKLGLQHGELTFLSQAAQTLVQCKRVLKWSYAFGFYIKDKSKALFEFGQKDLEKYSDELLEEIEIKYAKSIKNQDQKYDLKCFSLYKSGVIALTQKCQKFLTGFLAQIEQSPGDTA
eukprot:CAMPEP_0176424146 /NCGR_PEP_ID=MMETSP0127-20121128/10678_1 /TAXON_ID=938130 /ORGANISM="Platyophrya macrostoma, Strain WH" /LENGTH=444 /DNA_ID=CAMNT_0017805177 /DNA_START=91 /DNA_END=1425 /DNA_ORIENTATION=-